jgi:hypothetical protein
MGPETGVSPPMQKTLMERPMAAELPRAAAVGETMTRVTTAPPAVGATTMVPPVGTMMALTTVPRAAEATAVGAMTTEEMTKTGAMTTEEMTKTGAMTTEEMTKTGAMTTDAGPDYHGWLRRRTRWKHLDRLSD